MAIIIPSKDIYEINNQKVVDNEVDNIEVGVKNVTPSNEFYTPVYNDSFNVKENIKTTNYEKSDKADKDYLGSAGGYHDYIRLASTSQLSLTYKTIPEIRIKKLRGKDIISQIYYKNNDEGNPNIKYSLTAKIQTTRTYGIGYNPSTDTFNFYENTAPIDEEKNAYSYKDIDFSKTNSETIDINPPLTAVLQTELSAKVEKNTIISRVSITGIGSPPFDSIGKNYAVSEIEVPVEEILSFNSVEEIIDNKEEYYVIKGIKICVEVLCKLGYAYNISSTPQSQIGEVSGKYINGAIIKIVPSSVQVTIYGDTIGIDLQNETIKIGDGQHVYSFNGNELMQVSNTPSIEKTYDNIIFDWVSGKEIAKIKCAIADYGQVLESNIIINITEKYDLSSSFIYSARITFVPSEEISFSNLISIQLIINNNNYTIYSIKKLSSGEYNAFVDGVPFSSLKLGNYNGIYKFNNIEISPTNRNSRITFHIGDKVIPYVPATRGTDKPMSFYADKTPKEFLIIGKGIIADGELMQELTLQEIPKN